MTNSAELRKLIAARGLKLRYLASKLGITPCSLQRKIENVTEFKAGEIAILCNELNIGATAKEDIFFALCVDY